MDRDWRTSWHPCARPFNQPSSTLGNNHSNTLFRSFVYFGCVCSAEERIQLCFPSAGLSALEVDVLRERLYKSLQEELLERVIGRARQHLSSTQIAVKLNEIDRKGAGRITEELQKESLKPAAARETYVVQGKQRHLVELQAAAEQRLELRAGMLQVLRDKRARCHERLQALANTRQLLNVVCGPFISFFLGVGVE